MTKSKKPAKATPSKTSTKASSKKVTPKAPAKKASKTPRQRKVNTPEYGMVRWGPGVQVIDPARASDNALAYEKWAERLAASNAPVPPSLFDRVLWSPYLIPVGVLGLAAVAVGVYFWAGN